MCFMTLVGQLEALFPDASASSEKAESLIGDTLPHVDFQLVGFTI